MKFLLSIGIGGLVSCGFQASAMPPGVRSCFSGICAGDDIDMSPMHKNNDDAQTHLLASATSDPLPLSTKDGGDPQLSIDTLLQKCEIETAKKKPDTTNIQSQFLKLPNDILSKIASLLHPVDYENLRGVSKSFREAFNATGLEQSYLRLQKRLEGAAMERDSFLLVSSMRCDVTFIKDVVNFWTLEQELLDQIMVRAVTGGCLALVRHLDERFVSLDTGDRYTSLSFLSIAIIFSQSHVAAYLASRISPAPLPAKARSELERTIMESYTLRETSNFTDRGDVDFENVKSFLTMPNVYEGDVDYTRASSLTAGSFIYLQFSLHYGIYSQEELSRLIKTEVSSYTPNREYLTYLISQIQVTDLANYKIFKDILNDDASFIEFLVLQGYLPFHADHNTLSKQIVELKNYENARALLKHGAHFAVASSLVAKTLDAWTAINKQESELLSKHQPSPCRDAAILFIDKKIVVLSDIVELLVKVAPSHNDHVRKLLTQYKFITATQRQKRNLDSAASINRSPRTWFKSLSLSK